MGSSDKKEITMNVFKKRFHNSLRVFTILSLGIATSAMARTLTTYTQNKTSQSWKSLECVGSSCKSFLLTQAPIIKEIPEISSGTATLSAFFVDVSTTTAPVSCHASYNVNISTLAVVSVDQSSSTYHCSILLR